MRQRPSFRATRSPFLLSALALSLATPGAAAHAQRLRGEVVLADSATRAQGMIVIVTGVAGEVVGRTLTGPRGTFDIALPGPGRYIAKVLRIGYRPTTVPPFDIGRGEVRAPRIVLNSEAVALTRVTVRGQSDCRIRQDSGQLVARVWEEARKALTASQLSDDVPLVAEWIEYDRSLDSLGRIVRRQRIRSTRSPTTHAFASLPGDSLAQVGYVIAENDGARYFAPDAEALLSESFVAAHCFSVQPPPDGQPGLIGVGFRPARDREGIRDIEGTFWLDRASAELRWLEYRYTGLHPAATDAGAGGRVQFLRLGSGNWVIDRWNIRMPRLLAPRGTVRNPFGVNLLTGIPRLSAIEVAGGELTLVLRADSVVYRAEGATLLVRFTSPDTLVHAGGGMMAVDGTDYMALVDSAGLARLTPVLTGPYHLRVTTQDMDAIGAAPAEFDVEVKDGPPRELRLTLPRAAELMRSACDRESQRGGTGQLHGTVRDAGGRPIADAKLTVSWLSGAQNVGAGGFVVGTQGRDIVADGLGRWRLCGVPHLMPITVRLVDNADPTDTRRSNVTLQLGGGDPLAEVNLVGTTAAGNGSVAGLHSGLVEVTVVDRFGHPLSEATVDIIGRGVALRTLRTDSTGRAQTARVPSGRVELRVRRIGYRAGDLAVQVEPGRNTVPVMLDKSAAPSLDTIRIRGDRRVSARLDEFETRRARGEASASIGRDEIEKRHPMVLSQLLRNIPSIILHDSAGTTRVASSRGMVPKGGMMVLCDLRIMLDGIVLPPEVDIDQILPNDIHGIEVFAGPANFPVKYGSFNSGWCGIVAIWTRDR
jgi:hypothetical protein